PCAPPEGEAPRPQARVVEDQLGGSFRAHDGKEGARALRRDGPLFKGDGHGRRDVRRGQESCLSRRHGGGRPPGRPVCPRRSVAAAGSRTRRLKLKLPRKSARTPELPPILPHRAAKPSSSLNWSPPAFFQSRRAFPEKRTRSPRPSPSKSPSAIAIVPGAFGK